MASKTENFYKNDKVAWEVSKPGYLSESGEITLLKDEVINVELFKDTDWVWTNFPSEINYKYLTFADGYMPEYGPGVEDIAVVTPFSVRGTRHKLISINMHSDRPPVTPIEKNYPPILSTNGVTKMRVYSDFLETFDIYREMSRGGKLYHPGGTLEQIILSHTPNLTTFSVGNSGKLKRLEADDFSHVTSMRKAFMQNLALTYISPMYLDSCEDLSQMFVRCEFKEFPTTLYNTSKVKSTYGMLEECTNLTSIPLFDTQNVTDMQRMFYNCTSLISVPEFNTRNVTNMSHMLDGCGRIKSIPLFDTRNVTDTSYMLSSCGKLESVPLLDTSNVTNMVCMFNGCASLATVPLFDTQNVTDTTSMFSGCTSLTSVPLFDTQNVTIMYGMFNDCQSLISIPQLDTSKATSMREMFSNCSSLTSVPLFDTQNVINANRTFYNCTSLKNVGGFIGLKTDINFEYSPLTHDSALNVIDNLAVSTGHIVQFKKSTFNTLTPEDIAKATDKGWKIWSV